MRSGVNASAVTTALSRAVRSVEADPDRDRARLASLRCAESDVAQASLAPTRPDLPPGSVSMQISRAASISSCGCATSSRTAIRPQTLQEGLHQEGMTPDALESKVAAAAGLSALLVATAGCAGAGGAGGGAAAVAAVTTRSTS